MQPFQETPDGVTLRSPDDHESLRKSVFDGVSDQFKSNFPYTYGGVRIELDGEPEYADPETYDFKTQKDALLKDKFLNRRLRGGVKLFDDATGELLDSRKNVTFMKVPYVTDRGTVIHGGNEYAMINQARLIPGAYTRRQANGDLETQFNVRSGSGRRMQVTVNPEDMQYRLRVGGANLHFYSLMKDLNIPDERLERIWGKDIVNSNKGKYDRRVLPKAYDKMVPKRHQVAGASPEQMAKAVAEALEEAQVNRDVLEMNLPNLFDRIKAAEWRIDGERLERRQVELEKIATETEFAPDLTPEQVAEEMWISKEAGLDPDVAEWANWYGQYKPADPIPEDTRTMWQKLQADLRLKQQETPTPRNSQQLRALGVDGSKYLAPDDQKALQKSMQKYQWGMQHKSLRKTASILEEEEAYLEMYPDVPGSLKYAAEYLLKGSGIETPDSSKGQMEMILDYLEGLKTASEFDLTLSKVVEAASFEKYASEMEPAGNLLARCVFEKCARYGAGILFRNPDGSYLLEKNHPEPSLPPDLVGKLRPAGGGKSKRDRNLRQTIIREVGEEFGLEEDYVKERIKLLGYIPRGKFKDCAMFEMVDHGLKPGTYKATNSKTEFVELVKADIDDPDYIGCKPSQLRKFSLRGYRGVKPKKKWKSWVGVDLDGTLAEHDVSKPFDPLHIGKPIPRMMQKVRRLLKNGETVKIFTARAYDPVSVKAIQAWTREYLGQELEVTDTKDPGMSKLYDDRAVGIVSNKGVEKKAYSFDDPEWEVYNKKTQDLLKPHHESRDDHFYADGSCGHAIKRCRCRGKHETVVIDIPCFECYQKEQEKKATVDGNTNDLSTSPVTKTIETQPAPGFKAPGAPAAVPSQVAASPKPVNTAGSAPVPTPNFESLIPYYWNAENAQKTGYNAETDTWNTYDDKGTPAIGPGIRVQDPNITMTTEQLEAKQREVIQEHWERARKAYPGFDTFPESQQAVLLDHEYMGIPVKDLYSAAQSGAPFRPHIQLKNDRRERLLQEYYDSLAALEKQGSDQVDLDSVHLTDPNSFRDGVTWFVKDPQSVTVSVPDSADPEDVRTLEKYFQGKYQNVEVEAEVYEEDVIDKGNWSPVPEKLASEILEVQKGVREETYAVCPHCGEEIQEKSTYIPQDENDEFIYSNGNLVVQHRPCGGEFVSPPSESERAQLDAMKAYFNQGEDED